MSAANDESPASNQRPPEQAGGASDARAQFDRLSKQIEAFHRDPKARLRWESVAGQVVRPESLILAADREPLDVVFRRTGALLREIQAMPGAGDLSALERELARIRTEHAAAAADQAEARYRLFESALDLRRQIAFSNPLLDFDRILFIKRHFLPDHESWGYELRGNHMCDQYFGFHAVAGGGLFVLEDPFGPRPAVRNLLEDSLVENGRLAGRRLEPGGFLSPELSFDGSTILFAYSEARPTRYEWTEQSTFHIFRVNADGSGLRPLTDGPFNDFDPCELPDGRIAFVSERRGGYGRCHPRSVPLYTLHAMNADGTAVAALSRHEANEWQPSLTHDGRIVYTRWDYWDRGNIQAHHPWITAPDGSDARALQGNFGKSKGARPLMEMDVRAVPASHLYVATAAAHHGQAYGSLVLVDPRAGDDDAMGPVRRLTPEVPFPEAEAPYREGQVYATAWPLSPLFHLCVYDPLGAAPRGPENNHGLYLVDAFGNQVLLYRDPTVSCLSPMPLRARKRPPVIPPPALAGGAGPGPEREAQAGVVNVYDSLKPFPPDEKIAALRVIQVVPKTTPLIDQPKIGFGSEKGARAVLGTVPVERDGSAHFMLPAGVSVYFQALDGQGLAVQSMRSSTCAVAGGRLFCQGCHEPRQQAPPRPAQAPLAFRRPPSRIRPDVDGSNPFSYPRLVQPVLERSCVPCHRQSPGALDLTAGDWESDQHLHYRSYRNLKPFAFFYGPADRTYDAWTEPRTTPGAFGARASRLYALLDKGHCDEPLNGSDLHRLALWLDCNSDFFGSYELIEEQAAGAIVPPALQ